MDINFEIDKTKKEIVLLNYCEYLLELSNIYLKAHMLKECSEIFRDVNYLVWCAK